MTVGLRPRDDLYAAYQQSIFIMWTSNYTTFQSQHALVIGYESFRRGPQHRRLSRYGGAQGK